MRLYLIRHGLTLPTGPDSHEWPLSLEGEMQASKLADAPFWSKVSALYSSPEDKTLATVRPSSKKHGLDVVEDERLREARRAAIWYEDYDRVVSRYLRGSKDSPEGWEETSKVVRRVSECFSEIASRHPSKSVAICGHGLMFTLYLATLDSERDIFDIWSSIGFCEVAVVEDGRVSTRFDGASHVE